MNKTIIIQQQQNNININIIYTTTIVNIIQFKKNKVYINYS